MWPGSCKEREKRQIHKLGILIRHLFLSLSSLAQLISVILKRNKKKRKKKKEQGQMSVISLWK